MSIEPSPHLLLTVSIPGYKDDSQQSPPVPGRVTDSKEELPGAETEGRADSSAATAGGGEVQLPE